jgi:predicted site-specific integrase-resolvase
METHLKPTTRGWLKPKKGALYSGVSSKIFYGWLRNGLRHVRLENGRILTKYDWIDQFLEGFETKDLPQELVEELVEGMT